ncbi:hypothetical protein E2P81_ATG09741 [Venturia nashicola]|uniref:Uncharacterized protein n=1 Tax=Venturia nashicola TaxID=86259 RepID=A0A4Z1NQT2_9PEZI|nr:hypothetical protein E6O75_ATG09953 [Venturia nashicola]TLD14751.1 hypothetical protein E2P81_ATG09741 [Venturia nashicola]
MESDRDNGVEGLGVLGSGRVFIASVSDRKKRVGSGEFATVAAMVGCLDGMVADEFERAMCAGTDYKAVQGSLGLNTRLGLSYCASAAEHRGDQALAAKLMEAQKNGGIVDGGAVEELWRSCGGAVEELWRSCGGAVEELWRKLGVEAGVISTADAEGRSKYGCRWEKQLTQHVCSRTSCMQLATVPCCESALNPDEVVTPYLVVGTMAWDRAGLSLPPARAIYEQTTYQARPSGCRRGRVVAGEAEWLQARPSGCRRGRVRSSGKAVDSLIHRDLSKETVRPAPSPPQAAFSNHPVNTSKPINNQLSASLDKAEPVDH